MPIVLTGASAAQMNSTVMVFITIWGFCGWLVMTRLRDKGVLVAMNDEIHAAKYVTKRIRPMSVLSKLSTTAPWSHHETGKSSTSKQLNLVFALTLITYRVWYLSSLHMPVWDRWADWYARFGTIGRVWLSKPSERVIFQRETAQKLEILLQKGTPVALVSRCFNGIAEPVYALPRWGRAVAKAGVFLLKNSTLKSSLETPHCSQCRT